MRFKRRYGVNLEIVLRLIFLFGFTAFYYSTLKSGNVQYYVHPRVIPYMKFAMISFIVFALFGLGELYRTRRKSSKTIVYLIFIIPLLTAFLLPPRTINAKSISLSTANLEERYSEKPKSKIIEEDKSIEISPEITSVYDDIINSKENKLILEGDKILINPDNYIDWIDEIYMNIPIYEGKTVEMVGFILKDPSYKENEFVIARLMMVCCAADTQAVGFLCNYENALKLEDGSWAKIEGIIQAGEY